MKIFIYTLYFINVQLGLSNVFNKVSRQPDVPENNILASGNLSNSAKKEDLEKILSNDITFESKDGEYATKVM